MNATPPHKPHILFICGRNQWRSRKAQEIYANDQRMEVRSAGVSPISAHQVSRQDLKLIRNGTEGFFALNFGETQKPL